MRKGTLQVLMQFFFFFNWNKFIFIDASAEMFQSPYKFPPYLLSCLLQTHITYHHGVLFFSCKLRTFYLEAIRSIFSFINPVNLGQTYKATVPMTITPAVKEKVFFILKMYCDYLLKTPHGEIQSKLNCTTSTKFLAIMCLVH